MLQSIDTALSVGICRLVYEDIWFCWLFRGWYLFTFLGVHHFWSFSMSLLRYNGLTQGGGYYYFSIVCQILIGGTCHWVLGYPYHILGTDGFHWHARDNPISSLCSSRSFHHTIFTLDGTCTLLRLYRFALMTKCVKMLHLWSVPLHVSYDRQPTGLNHLEEQLVYNPSCQYITVHIACGLYLSAAVTN